MNICLPAICVHVFMFETYKYPSHIGLYHVKNVSN